MKTNVVLIGFRGVGKSTISITLSRALGWPRLEIDDEVRKRIGLISESVQRHGWKPFHDAERDIVAALEVTQTVIDAGGGIVRAPENLRDLARHAHIVMLDASPGTIVARLGRSHERPMIGSARSIEEEVEQELPKREPLYRAAADLVVTTEGKSADDIAGEIITTLGLEAKN